VRRIVVGFFVAFPDVDVRSTLRNLGCDFHGFGSANPRTEGSCKQHFAVQQVNLKRWLQVMGQLNVRKGFEQRLSARDPLIMTVDETIDSGIQS
jgi:hypothetical protein